MAVPFALAEISDLGRRAVGNPAAGATQWSGMAFGTDELRVLHAVMNPTLLLAALAGYETTTVWLFSAAATDALEIDLTTRTAWPVAAVSLEASAVVASTGFTAVVQFDTRPGLNTTVVPFPELTLLSDRWVLVQPLGATPTVPQIVDALHAAQTPAAQSMAQRIAIAAIADGTTRTGLVSLLDPDLWDLPDAVVTEGSGPRAEALRDLGRPIARAALRDANTLLAFLLEESLGRSNGTVPSVHLRLRNEIVPPTQIPMDPPISSWDVQDLETTWRQEARATFDLLFPDAATRPPFRTHDHRVLTYTELVLDAANFGLFDTVAFDVPTGTLAYGGFDLRHTRPAVAPAVAPPTDRDPDPTLNQPQTYVYGGVTHTETFTRAEDVPKHVQELRDDLTALGYGPLLDGDGTTDALRRTFGPWLEAAVREFQIYASMEQVARTPLPTEPQPGAGGSSLGSTLIPVENDHRYDGPLSGLLNARTRELIKMWVEREWHCPVVVEVRAVSNTQAAAMRTAGPTVDRTPHVLAAALGDANVWLPRQAPQTNRAFVVWDHTGTCAALPYHAGEPMVLCGYSANEWGGAAGIIAGRSSSAVLYPAAEVAPANVFPVVPDRGRDPAAYSTFRVIRAVSEVECMGYMDGINGYDTAITSGGPLHQTLGLMKNENGGLAASPTAAAVLYPGELGGFLEYFAAVEPAEYDTLFGRFGVQPANPWVGAGGPQFVPAHRKYSGFLRLQAEDGTFVDHRRQQVPGQAPTASTQDSQLAETFKTWHWTHRILYASRTSRVMAHRMWEFTRARVRELLSTPWRVGGVDVQMTVVDADGNASSRAATLADMFTSERTVAALVRQHVYNPPHLFGVSDRAAQWTGAGGDDIDFRNVAGLYATASAGANPDDPGLWGDAQQTLLAAEMDDAAGPLAANGLDHVAAWQTWGTGSNFFGYDRSWLPMAGASPVMDPPANITVVRGSSVPVALNARTASAFPVTLDLAIGGDPAGVIVSTSADGSDLAIEVEPTADLGRFTATVTASDGLYVSTVQFDIDISDADDPPSDVVYPPPTVAEPKLDVRHGSFLLDADDLDPFPPP